jgi:hypothetical protein
MGKCTINSREAQEERAKIKTLNHQMEKTAVEGTGLSPWEAKVLVDCIEDIYFSEQNIKSLKAGQMRYSCVQNSEGAGKPIKDCKMVTLTLTIFADDDNDELDWKGKNASIMQRQRRVMRFCDEAFEQGGLLSQEDLCKLLMCDVRTIRRDIKALKGLGIIVPTRGTIKDIGPGVTHREVAINAWLEGKEPSEVCNQIKHSLKAVENYIEKFKRVAYLCQKKFNNFEISRTVGISVGAAKTFVEIYENSKNKSFFKNRMDEINIVGSQYYNAQDEKKDSRRSKPYMNERLARS